MQHRRVAQRKRITARNCKRNETMTRSDEELLMLKNRISLPDIDRSTSDTTELYSNLNAVRIIAQQEIREFLRYEDMAQCERDAATDISFCITSSKQNIQERDSYQFGSCGDHRMNRN